MEAATCGKDMPDSQLPALSDIVVIAEPPGSTVVNPHDIPLNPFCTQPSQDPEFATQGYPPSAPQVDLLRASQPLNPLNPDDGRDYMQEEHNQLAEYNAQQAQDKDDARRHHSLLKVEHQNSKANRRGPMDEMRQLVRILVKLIPESVPLLKLDETGGGNRVTEEEIKHYLEAVIGENAPQPKWGLPDGWGSYLAELFTWAAGRPVSRDDAMRCAKRLPGRSWEAVEDELLRLGLRPTRWPLPLTQQGVRDANSNAQHPRMASAPPSMALHPRQDAGKAPLQLQQQQQEDHPAAPRRKKPRLSVQDQVEPMIKDATEKECWYLAMRFLQGAKEKVRATPANRVEELQGYQHAVKKLAESVFWPQSSAMHSVHPGTYQGGEPLYHHQYSLPARADQYYLQSTSAIVPVPVALGTLGMQTQLVQPGLQNYSLASQGQLAPGIGLSILDGGADGGADSNPSKPLRPTARSVHLGMHPAAYQLMPTSAAEPAMGGKVAADTQKFLGGSVFAPYMGGASKPFLADPLDLRTDAMPSGSLLMDALNAEGASASAAVGEGGVHQQPSKPGTQAALVRQKLKGMLAQLEANACGGPRVDALLFEQPKQRPGGAAGEDPPSQPPASAAPVACSVAAL